MTNATQILATLPIEKLKKVALLAFNDQRLEAGFALNQILNALETKMPQQEFINFCDQF